MEPARYTTCHKCGSRSSGYPRVCRNTLCTHFGQHIGEDFSPPAEQPSLTTELSPIEFDGLNWLRGVLLVVVTTVATILRWYPLIPGSLVLLALLFLNRRRGAIPHLIDVFLLGCAIAGVVYLLLRA